MLRNYTNSRMQIERRVSCPQQQKIIIKSCDWILNINLRIKWENVCEEGKKWDSTYSKMHSVT